MKILGTHAYMGGPVRLLRKVIRFKKFVKFGILKGKDQLFKAYVGDFMKIKSDQILVIIIDRTNIYTVQKEKRNVASYGYRLPCNTGN